MTSCCVVDNGRGIDKEIAAAGMAGHFGISGMRERASSIGGSLSIESADPGTRVTLVVPGHRLRTT